MRNIRITASSRASTAGTVVLGLLAAVSLAGCSSSGGSQTEEQACEIIMPVLGDVRTGLTSLGSEVTTDASGASAQASALKSDIDSFSGLSSQITNETINGVYSATVTAFDNFYSQLEVMLTSPSPEAQTQYETLTQDTTTAVSNLVSACPES